jgi:hypothetical protein
MIPTPVLSIVGEAEATTSATDWATVHRRWWTGN